VAVVKDSLTTEPGPKGTPSVTSTMASKAPVRTPPRPAILGVMLLTWFGSAWEALPHHNDGHVVGAALLPAARLGTWRSAGWTPSPRPFSGWEAPVASMPHRWPTGGRPPVSVEGGSATAPPARFPADASRPLQSRSRCRRPESAGIGVNPQHSYRQPGPWDYNRP